MLYNFSEMEVAEIKKHFPDLELVEEGIWRGTIKFFHVYHDYRIADEYEVEISVPADFPDTLARMSEIGGKTEAIAAKYQITDLRDLHKNPGVGTACLCVKQEEHVKVPPGSSLVDFINELVIPYLYGLSYYDEQGKWPWSDYGHGFRGVIEFYGESSIPQDKKLVNGLVCMLFFEADKNPYIEQLSNLNPDAPCICGKSLTITACHPNLLLGLERFRADIDRHDLGSMLPDREV